VEPLTSKRLVKIRSALGLTQEKLATLLGCSWVSVSRWEQGHSSPLPAVADIYRALDDALRGGHPATQIIEAARSDRGAFLQRLFTMAYGAPKKGAR
jgi:transcriptional regulator with XRE-family HTH domain